LINLIYIFKIFIRIVEACILLNMLPSGAILLIETLENEEEKIIIEVLVDVNIHQLSPMIALKVLRNRMDISTRLHGQKSFVIN
jgi:hypothetical protein